MKLSPLIEQFSRFLPKYTNKFTDEFDIATISAVGSLVTVTTSTPYQFNNLAGVSFVFMNQVLEALPIISFTYDSDTGIVEATTATDNGLTESMNLKTVKKKPLTVDLINNTNTALNGTFPLLTSPNRLTFTFQFLKDQVGVSVDGNVINYAINRVGGLKEITATSTTSFTYDVGQDLTGVIIDSPNQMTVRGNIRISGAANEARAQLSYTAKTTNSSFNDDTKFWLILTYGSVTTSKDRVMDNDAVLAMTGGADPRHFLIEEFNAIVFAPTPNSISGRTQRDEIEDVKVAIFRTILNFPADNVYASNINENYNYVFTAGLELVYLKAYLMYQFTFQVPFDVTFNDMFTDFQITPFRDIIGTIDINEKGKGQMGFDVDLDDDPL